MKILLVDDQATNRQIIRWIVEEDGHEVTEAEDGKAAIELFDDTQPDLVLLDVVMPVMDGYETANYLKENYSERHTPIVFLTAIQSEEDLSKCLDCGGDDFLVKPISITLLRAKIRAHERINQMDRQLRDQNQKLVYFRNRTEQEHELAERVFETAIQQNAKDLNCINAYLSPMMAFNGDIYLSSITSSGSLIIMLGDFTGHGLSASIGTIPASQTFFACVRKNLVVGDIAQEINRSLLKVLPDDMFCAATIIELSSAGDNLTVWAGGLPDAYIVSEQSGVRKNIRSGHMPLGILDTKEFDRSVEIISVEHGERVFLYSDGVIETHDPDGNMFGEERFEKLLQLPAGEIFDTTIKTVYDFQGGEEQDDDISLIELLCIPVEHGELKESVGGKEASPILPWKFSVDLDVKNFKSEDPITGIVDVLGASEDIKPHKDFLYTLLTELYSNSLEHGLLDLDSELKMDEEGYIEYYELRAERLSALSEGNIEFNFEVAERMKSESSSRERILKVQVKDSGKGFEINNLTISDEDLAHGRGVNLVEELCENVVYSDGGRQVDLEYLL